MDANELIEKGTRAAYATYDDSVEWDEAPPHPRRTSGESQWVSVITQAR